MRQFLSLARRRSTPRLPQGVRVYAVGDVHGRADLLARVLSQIEDHLAQNPVSRPIEVFLGDYVDRGPDSRRVIDLLIKRRETRETIFLKGNHEAYLLEFLKDPKILDDWRQCGGFETLLSYGVQPSLKPKSAERKELARSFGKILPDDHLRFLSQLMTHFTCGDFLFVHAGVQPGIPLDRQREDDLLWIRDDFLLSDQDFGKYIVHGHTPVREPDIRPNRVNIDTGAFATGRLTCLVIEGEEMQVIAQVSDDRREGFNNNALVNETIAQNDLLPAAEFPDLSYNSPTIAPQEAVIESAGDERPSQPTPDPPSAAAEHSTDASPTAVRPQPAPLINRPAPQEIPPAARPRLPGFVTPLVIAMIAVGVTSTLMTPRLIPQRENNANIDQDKTLSGTRALAQTTQAGSGVQSELRLILQQSVSGIDGEAVPLGVQVSGEAAGSALEISGLPSAMTISSGRPLGEGAWRILATDVADAMIDPRPGFVGAVDLQVELRLADDTVIDRGSLHREWSQRQTVAAVAAEPAATLLANTADPETVTQTATNHDAGRSALDSQLDHEQIDFLIGRSQTLISEGDVEAARILLQRAAEARDARAALALGATYDPIMLAILQAHGVSADVSRARDWYHKANEFGSQEALQRLNLLATVTP